MHGEKISRPYWGWLATEHIACFKSCVCDSNGLPVYWRVQDLRSLTYHLRRGSINSCIVDWLMIISFKFLHNCLYLPLTGSTRRVLVGVNRKEWEHNITSTPISESLDSSFKHSFFLLFILSFFSSFVLFLSYITHKWKWEVRHLW